MKKDAEMYITIQSSFDLNMLLVVSTEKVVSLSTVSNIFALSEYLSSFLRSRIRQQKSLGAAVSFLLAFCCSFAYSVQLNQAMSSPPPQNRSDENTRDKDLHSSESCMTPVFWIALLIVSGTAEGWVVFPSVSVMLQENAT